MSPLTPEFARLADLGWRAPDPDPLGVVDLTSRVGEEISYPESGLGVLELDSGQGFWFDHRAAAIIRSVQAQGVSALWDVGSGTGSVAARLADSGIDVVSVEPMRAGAAAAAARGLPAVCGTLESLQLPADALESVGLFDVIEHLRSPRQLLGEVRRVTRPGGFVFVTVPAYGWLWGDEDDVAGHYRRYTPRSLVADFAHCGMRPISIEYLFAALVPAAAFARALPYRLGRRKTQAQVLGAMKEQLEPNPAVERAAIAVLNAESVLSRRFRLPFGLSVLGVFRRVP